MQQGSVILTGRAGCLFTGMAHLPEVWVLRSHLLSTNRPQDASSDEQCQLGRMFNKIGAYKGATAVYLEVPSFGYSSGLPASRVSISLVYSDCNSRLKAPLAGAANPA